MSVRIPIVLAIAFVLLGPWFLVDHGLSQGPRTLPPAPGASGVVPAPSPAIGAVASSAATPSGSVTLGRFASAGPSPPAWGPLGLPPGAEALSTALGHSPAGARASPEWQNRFCAGLWPYTSDLLDPQSVYASGCYGHDEPGIQFYSPLPGSGGNVSWDVTLPVDRSPTQNQSDLYDAIWFGMTLTDPLGWMHQCFLELQFYPDQLWVNPGPSYPNWTVNGKWIGAAVAWQLEASNWTEDPCFFQKLYNGSATSGTSYFIMDQGDRINVTMTGWAGSATGEALQITDVTQGQSSNLTLWDSQGGYPLNPSYPSNSFENSLQWTPGGQYPVAFSFEIGHAGDPGIPENNSFGGCSPGPPPATPAYPSVPCPSYDPGSWANDSLYPWHISAPSFFNDARVDRPAQVAFTQDFGGVGTLSDVGLGACDGRLGSAWCSYPWYSYSCGAQAFEFGATDYPGTSVDFGQYNEYTVGSEDNGAGLEFYPPRNYSIPTCASSGAALSIAASGVPGGSVYFLSEPVSAGTVQGLSLGNYSIFPVAPEGAFFQDWTVGGAVSLVSSPTDPWGTVDVNGDGTLVGWFTTTPVLTNVSFVSAGAPSGGRIVLSAARTYTDGVPFGTFSDGEETQLPPGVYGVQGLPPVGANFSRWTIQGPGGSLAPVDFPYAWLDVNGAGGDVTLAAEFAPSPAQNVLTFGVIGNGTMTFNGTATTFSLPANLSSTAGAPNVTVAVGAYVATATPDPGYAFAGWQWFGSIVLTDYRAVANVTAEFGVGFLFASFVAVPVPPVPADVLLADNPANGGRISFDGATALPDASVVSTALGVHTLSAEPEVGRAFTNWSVNDSTEAWILPGSGGPSSQIAEVLLNGTVTVTASFVSASRGSLYFNATPSVGGTIVFDGRPYVNGSVNTSVTNGLYTAFASPSAGYHLLGLSFAGSVAAATSALGPAAVVYGALGSLTALFARNLTPVTFVANTPDSASFQVNGTPVGSGETLWLPSGYYPVVASIPTAQETLAGWKATPGLAFGSASNGSGTLAVAAVPGTLTAIIVPFAVSGPSVIPNVTEVGRSVQMGVNVTGVGPFDYAWGNLPGCPSSNSPLLACLPTLTGYYLVSVTITDPHGEDVTVVGDPAGQGWLLVYPALAVLAVTFSPASTDVGVPVTVGTTSVGGTPPLQYTYGGLPSGCSGASSSFACRPSAAGTFSVNVTVVDSLGGAATGHGTLRVNPVPSVSALTASPTPSDVGFPVLLTTSVNGGTAPFTFSYSGLPIGCATRDAANLSCVPTAAGSYSVTTTVTDAVGLSALLVGSVVIVPAPSVSVVSAAPAVLDLGMSTLLSASASGTGSLSYQWYGLPSGCASTDAATLTCTPNQGGTWNAGVTVSDPQGGSGIGSVQVTVHLRPTASLTASSSNVTVGDPVTFIAVAGEGTPDYAYAFAGLPPGCGTPTTPSFQCSPSSTGTFTVVVTVSDSLHQSANASVTVTVTGGSASGFSPAAVTGLALAVVAAAVLAILFLLYRRRRQGRPGRLPVPGAAPPPPPPT